MNIVEEEMLELSTNVIRNVEEISWDLVKINNLKIDELQTYVEKVPIDLINMQEDRQQSAIGQITRLNHKRFTLSMDITSERQQRVVVRTLLIPKIDVMGKRLTIEKQRQNTILLDIMHVDLNVGRNVISRNSKDITWTGRDVTLYSEIYERIMLAMQDNVDLTIKPIVGQTTLMPHRLLLPRGRIDGLPMQLMVIITPIQEHTTMTKMTMMQGTNLGMDSLILDNLPLTYPMDREMKNIQKFPQLTNVMLKDVMIYHNEEQVM
uniref:Hemocyanin n=1 Tax=Musca domestica TaxID=7370 RepID=T1PHH0_MUSDO